MKNLILLITLLGLFSCTDKNEVNLEIENQNSIPELSYNFDNGESFSTNEPIMHYDTSQEVTFIKYTDDDIKLRINFRGNTSGVYTDENGIFLKYSYDQNGNQSIDMVCDTYTGIVVTVDEYGEIGEMIKGSFTADNCDGLSTSSSVTGSFSVIRTE